ncbi:type II toxin-antitoxin system HicB family antitoxin [Asaia krungthepensis]|uniref:CopG family DNA-binding protein n=1 Tax=Asaia krungthepensis NRIC 0535 TaxID=1307925 RepID=A0ABQ0Q6D5_9PROT|nr:type II toxin-antitoxin system HicB family antitoxin [Asaia krungthepensis]GBQ93481.1 CopG family DNA-binding protein [Asaia krungthepensis NRIC 0535]
MEDDTIIYPIIIEAGSETEAYGVIVPDLPGCFSAGDTFNEALSNAAKAITLWIEDATKRGCPVPDPSSFEQLQARSEWTGPDWLWGYTATTLTTGQTISPDRSRE